MGACHFSLENDDRSVITQVTCQMKVSDKRQLVWVLDYSSYTVSFGLHEGTEVSLEI